MWSLTAALASRWFTQVAAEEWITAIEKAKQGKRKSGKKGGTFALINHFGPRPRYSHVRVVGRVVSLVACRTDPLSGEGDTKLSLLSSQAEDVPEGAGTAPLHLFFFSFLYLFFFSVA